MINFIARQLAKLFTRKRKLKDVEELILTREEILRIKKDRAIKEWENEIKKK